MCNLYKKTIYKVFLSMHKAVIKMDDMLGHQTNLMHFKELTLYRICFLTTKS